MRRWIPAGNLAGYPALDGRRVTDSGDFRVLACGSMENHTGVTRQRALRSDWRGERRALTARVEIELAEEIEAKAAAAGVSVSDYLAGVIRSSTKGARR